MPTKKSQIEIDCRYTVESHWANIVWQKMFDLYVDAGGDLTNMSDILYDYCELKEWINTSCSNKIFWGFDKIGLTIWRESSANGNVFIESVLEYEFPFVIEYTKNNIFTITELDEAINRKK